MNNSKSLGSADIEPPRFAQVQGSQRKEILLALDIPRTAKGILNQAKKRSPKLNYQDLRQILRSFESRKLVWIVNPKEQTGRIYALTAKGSAIAERQFAQFSFKGWSHGCDLRLLARLSRSKLLLAALKAFVSYRMGPDRRTPTQIRRLMADTHPSGMSAVIGAIRRLEGMGLVARRPNRNGDQRLQYYSITPKGRILAENLGA